MPARPVRRNLALGLAAALLLTLLSACSTGGGGDRLTVYSGRSKELIGPLLTRFSEETGVEVDVRYGDSADLALQIATEGDKSPADVFISQSPGATAYLEGEGMLEELPAEVLDEVGEDVRSPTGRWVGLTGRVRVLVYNTDEVDEADLPASVFDLTDPAYQGKVGVAPTNASFQDFVTALRAIDGGDRAEAWLQGMADNDSPTYPNNVSIVEAVASGEIPMGLVNHYYIARAHQDDPDTEAEVHFFPEGDPGSLLLVTAAAQVKGTEQADDVQRLATFLLSEESQRFFADETQEYPLVPGVEPDEEVIPLAEVPVTRIDLDTLGGGLKETQQLIEASGIG